MEQVENDGRALEARVGLPEIPTGITNEVHKWLGLTPVEIRSVSGPEAFEGAYVLSQFSLNVQRTINAEECRLVACEENIRRLAAPHFASIGGYGKEERLSQALLKSPKALEFDSLRVQTRLKLTRLAYLSFRIDSMVKILSLRAK